VRPLSAFLTTGIHRGAQRDSSVVKKTRRPRRRYVIGSGGAPAPESKDPAPIPSSVAGTVNRFIATDFGPRRHSTLHGILRLRSSCLATSLPMTYFVSSCSAAFGPEGRWNLAGWRQPPDYRSKAVPSRRDGGNAPEMPSTAPPARELLLIRSGGWRHRLISEQASGFLFHVICEKNPP
jgi:hypothetical protein